MLVFHTVISVRALMDFGFFDLFRFAYKDWASAQLFSDLTMCLVLLSSWMIVDSRRTGRTVWPWLLATMLLGSFAPLTYLLVGELRASKLPIA